MSSEADWFVYLLRCSDGTYYTGITTHIERRIEQHNNGTGARYTRGRLPVVLCWFEQQSSHSTALKREMSIKRLQRKEKAELANAASLFKK
ncbi:MAG: GIY-YIG nuclease family protein [Patescibacteria group bacterium]